MADTSAWARAGAKEVAPQWREVVKAGDLIACPLVTMEMIFDAPDHDSVERVAVAMAGFRQAPISRSVPQCASQADYPSSRIAAVSSTLEMISES